MARPVSAGSLVENSAGVGMSLEGLVSAGGSTGSSSGAVAWGPPAGAVP